MRTLHSDSALAESSGGVALELWSVAAYEQVNNKEMLLFGRSIMLIITYKLLHHFFHLSRESTVRIKNE